MFHRSLLDLTPSDLAGELFTVFGLWLAIECKSCPLCSLQCAQCYCPAERLVFSLLPPRESRLPFALALTARKDTGETVHSENTWKERGAKRRKIGKE